MIKHWEKFIINIKNLLYGLASENFKKYKKFKIKIKKFIRVINPVDFLILLILELNSFCVQLIVELFKKNVQFLKFKYYL